MHTRMMMAAALVSASICLAADPYTFTQGGWMLTVSPRGEITGLADKTGRQLVSADNNITVVIGAAKGDSGKSIRSLRCTQPVDITPISKGIAFEYAGDDRVPLRVRHEITFQMIGGEPTLKRMVVLTPSHPPLTLGFNLFVANAFVPPGRRTVLVPRADGMADQIDKMESPMWTYELGPASGAPGVTPADRLAIPFISLADEAGKLRITHIGDPLFTTSFRVDTVTADRLEVSLSCGYDGAQVPLTEPFTRTFWTVIHDGPPERAMDAWYATALADVPPGPAWLHDVAMHCYDYLSHGGKGWFEDIDAAEKLIAPADRGKMVFALHGWYDMLGRYTYDATSGKLDDAWTAFPNAPAVKDRFPTSESVKMSKAEMHRRIRYAKDRGFRVVLYYADGLTACEGAGPPANDQLLSWGGWQGPDTVGKPYTQNPAHPAVYKWYVDYLKALLAEYGHEIDGFVWDETFMIRAGTIAPAQSPRPAYLAPIFMQLTRELTQVTTAYGKDLAFLASDCQGVPMDEKTRWLDVPPYAIMAHGTYQDSHSDPSAWPYGIFANYRNTLWSCNWQAVTRFDFTQFGVEHYGTPVAVTNGWLDDKGLARLSDAERTAVMQLFKARKDKPQHLQWLSGPAPVFKSQAK